MAPSLSINPGHSVTLEALRYFNLYWGRSVVLGYSVVRIVKLNQSRLADRVRHGLGWLREA